MRFVKSLGIDQTPVKLDPSTRNLSENHLISNLDVFLIHYQSNFLDEVACFSTKSDFDNANKG